MPQMHFTKNDIDELIKAFTTHVNNLDSIPSSINVPVTLPPKKDIKKRNILFSPTAWAKMTQLVALSDKEIGWHSLVKKINSTTYYIYDCLVYPQTVTATTIDPDDTETALWRQSLPDNVIEFMHCQGHSHVNMSVSPSGTDLNYYNQIINELRPGQFYIFLIVNKKGEICCKVVEPDDNYIYNTEDCVIDIYTSHKERIKNWVTDEIKKNVKQKTYNYGRSYPNTSILDDNEEGRWDWWNEMAERASQPHLITPTGHAIPKATKTTKTTKTTKKTKKGGKK